MNAPSEVTVLPSLSEPPELREPLSEIASDPTSGAVGVDGVTGGVTMVTVFILFSIFSVFIYASSGFEMSCSSGLALDLGVEVTLLVAPPDGAECVLVTDPRRLRGDSIAGSPDAGDASATARLAAVTLGRLTGGWAIVTFPSVPSVALNFRTLEGGVVLNPSTRLTGLSADPADPGRRPDCSEVDKGLPLDGVYVPGEAPLGNREVVVPTSDEDFDLGLPPLPVRLLWGIVIATEERGVVGLVFTRLIVLRSVTIGLRMLACNFMAASSTCRTSSGMGTLCTMLTAIQSAGGTIWHSEINGGRQQPGHPRL